MDRQEFMRLVGGTATVSLFMHDIILASGKMQKVRVMSFERVSDGGDRR